MNIWRKAYQQAGFAFCPLPPPRGGDWKQHQARRRVALKRTEGYHTASPVSEQLFLFSKANSDTQPWLPYLGMVTQEARKYPQWRPSYISQQQQLSAHMSSNQAKESWSTWPTSHSVSHIAGVGLWWPCASHSSPESPDGVQVRMHLLLSSACGCVMLWFLLAMCLGVSSTDQGDFCHWKEFLFTARVISDWHWLRECM